jgi:hypothetical protein
MKEIFFWLQSERARDNTTTNLFYFLVITQEPNRTMDMASN